MHCTKRAYRAQDAHLGICTFLLVGVVHCAVYTGVYCCHVRKQCAYMPIGGCLLQGVYMPPGVELNFFYDIFHSPLLGLSVSSFRVLFCPRMMRSGGLVNGSQMAGKKTVKWRVNDWLFSCVSWFLCLA